MDYKVHVDAGKEDCYYQYVQQGAAFYVSFQVSNWFHHSVLYACKTKVEACFVII